jgi:hypothetical protein
VKRLTLHPARTWWLSSSFLHVLPSPVGAHSRSGPSPGALRVFSVCMHAVDAERKFVYRRNEKRKKRHGKIVASPPRARLPSRLPTQLARTCVQPGGRLALLAFHTCPCAVVAFLTAVTFLVFLAFVPGSVRVWPVVSRLAKEKESVTIECEQARVRDGRSARKQAHARETVGVQDGWHVREQTPRCYVVVAAVAACLFVRTPLWISSEVVLG